MNVHKFARKDLAMFGNIAKMLGDNQEALKPLIDLAFSKENFKLQIEKKRSFSKVQREVLVDAIIKQYQNAGIVTPDNVVKLLDDRCFTVCTGHQLNIFSGPFYTIYKIAHTIKLAEQLGASYPDFTFLPVFWMATEDHDLEEINHFYVADKKITWQTDQSGPVGRMHLPCWQEWMKELSTLFPHHNAKLESLLKVYQGDNLSQATRNLFHFLFQETPLIIIDGDEATLKNTFAATMRQEIETQFALRASLVSAQVLKDKGLKEQAFVREINLFYLSNNERKRIEHIDGQIVIGDKKFAQHEILSELERQPEQFSPNVILRPVYQETILPNLCYIGGAGELAYWLQLKPVFEAAKIPFPLIQLRFSALICSEKEWRQMQKLGFDFKEFSKGKDHVLRDLLRSLSQRNQEKEQLEIQQLINQLRDLLVEQAQKVDLTLIASAEARMKNVEKQISAFDEKLKRNERKSHRDTLARTEKLHASFFPNGIPQERHQNFISTYLDTKGGLIDFILINLNSFDDEFLVFEV